VIKIYKTNLITIFLNKATTTFTNNLKLSKIIRQCRKLTNMKTNIKTKIKTMKIINNKVRCKISHKMISQNNTKLLSNNKKKFTKNLIFWQIKM
jgi:hypothetical protein